LENCIFTSGALWSRAGAVEIVALEGESEPLFFLHPVRPPEIQRPVTSATANKEFTLFTALESREKRAEEQEKSRNKIQDNFLPRERLPGQKKSA
jgi:hypothetical protein